MVQNCKQSSVSAFEVNEQQLLIEKTFAAQAKAMSHPARIQILKILFNLDEIGGCLSSDLVSEVGLAQSTVSEHIRILKQAGFIAAEPKPPKICYRINRTALADYQQQFNDLF
ncbi:transcriptional regulator [Shewanella sp. UCD-FRSSP16_17]|uniref:ArsR/SmtB family transcription factor n=1 Tax=Shewanella sp. UCD-FRSSP16_17 TaxID=1853256 RepID=UPI0007EEACCF|nr:winged helix-turn-helix domain-containing protein [Shewanella sp. UCD-FRSSP16_17]OBT11400.1 transcriptional regulator [Shewanella sp. UCD-FRSSP16_17]